MSLFSVVFLAMIQGLTEFIPVSSSGHLVLVPYLFDWPMQPAYFDVVLHLGTAFALLGVFYEELVSIIMQAGADLFRHKFDFAAYGTKSILGAKLLVASIPAIFIGVALGSLIESFFRAPIFVVVFLILGAFLMYIAEKRTSMKTTIKKTTSLLSLSYLQAFFIGCFQSLALFPGFSRSGATISASMLVGLSRQESARFSFLMAVPVVFLAAIYQLTSVILSGTPLLSLPLLLVGLAVSFLAGLVAIKFMLSFVQRQSLMYFVGYRLLLAIFLLYTFVK